MNYLDPKSDVVFKKLFGDITHKNILISFLNSVLGRTEGKTIVDVVMNDPNNLPESQLSKTSIVDVRCTDQNGNQYIVEMQVVTQKEYAARAQYYSALALSRQLSSREPYSSLVPVIFVGVLDFELFSTRNYVSHHFILDSQTYQHELRHLEFHFIELPKFTKGLDDLDAILDKWIYFLKNAETLHKVPEPLAEPDLKDAFDVLAHGLLSKAELEAYDRYLDEYRSGIGQREAVIENTKLAVARELLDVLDVATIAKKVGLSVEQVEELKKRTR